MKERFISEMRGVEPRGGMRFVDCCRPYEGGGGSPTPPTPTADYLYLEAAQANSTVSAMLYGENADFNIQYSTDGVTWQEWNKTAGDNGYVYDTITLGAIGDTVYFKGSNECVTDDDTWGFIFVLGGSIAAGGNVMSILDPTMQQTEVPELGLAMLFSDNTALNTPADMLSVTTIGDSGCFGMYMNCTSLTKAADMPNVTNIAASGCGQMYTCCTAMTTAADMAAITTIGRGGCSQMYSGCTSLTAAANMPSLTTIGESGCSNMYSFCTSLTAAANMPSLTDIGAGGCETMYDDCTFDMSNDGSTLNFDFLTPPITAGSTTYSTAYDVANWMGNTNGFGGN